MPTPRKATKPAPATPDPNPTPEPTPDPTPEPEPEPTPESTPESETPVVEPTPAWTGNYVLDARRAAQRTNG